MILLWLYPQQHYKDKRMERLMTLKGQHRYVIDMVSEFFAVEPEVILNNVIDYAKYIEVMDSLFVEGGRCAIMFFCHDSEPPEIG